MTIRISPILLIVFIVLLAVGVYRQSSVVEVRPVRRVAPGQPPRVELTPDILRAAAWRVFSEVAN